MRGIYINISSLWQLRGNASSGSLAALDTRGTQSLDFEQHPPGGKNKQTNKNLGFLEKWLIPRLDQEKFKKSWNILRCKKIRGCFVKRWKLVENTCQPGSGGC